MLVVDPLKRITIAKIRAHPWFQTNLPPYLQDPDLHGAQVLIDNEVLDEILLKFEGEDREKVIDDLVNHRVTHVTAAYNLTLDHKRRQLMQSGMIYLHICISNDLYRMGWIARITRFHISCWYSN